ncbi:MAG: hypothetical protein K8T91_12945 [Planctomycetes bacterium]|nr:hypothetical protein [Planctomycetota bacterium]
MSPEQIDILLAFMSWTTQNGAYIVKLLETLAISGCCISGCLLCRVFLSGGERDYPF